MCCALVERGAARDQVNAEVNKAFMHLSVAGKEDQCCVEGKGQQEVMAAGTVAQNKTTLSIFVTLCSSVDCDVRQNTTHLHHTFTDTGNGKQRQ